MSVPQYNLAEESTEDAASERRASRACPGGPRNHTELSVQQHTVVILASNSERKQQHEEKEVHNAVLASYCSACLTVALL